MDAAKAELVRANLNLEYARVTAPISGRIGRQMVTEGALVGQNEATLLATIQQIDPIYLNLTQSSAELLRLRQMMNAGTLKDTDKSGLKVTMVMEDGTIFDHTGKLLFSDITVDPTTGELTIRALFPNPQNMVLPGMYVRARMEQAINENAITVPQQAVIRANDGSSVMVLNNEDKVEVRKVKTGAAVGASWEVLEGLKPGDRVVVEGLQKIKAGAPVRAVPWEDPLKPKAEPVQQPQAAIQNGSDTATSGNNAEQQAAQPATQQTPAVPQQNGQPATSADTPKAE